MLMANAQPREEESLLTEFSKSFNAFETKNTLFEELVDARGFAWWDLVRYSVQFAICTERGIWGQRRIDVGSPFARCVRAARRAATLARTQMALSTFSPRAAQIASGRSDLFVYSRLTPVLQQALQAAGENALRIGMPGSGAGRASNGLTKKGLEALVALRARFASCPPHLAREAEQLDRLLKNDFGSQLDFAALIKAKYRAHLVDSTIWQRLLATLPRSGTLHFINDDTTRTLTALARAHGLRTREYQHAYMGLNHFAFNQPPQARGIPTLPNEIFVHRDTGDIVVPTNIVRVEEPKKPTATGLRDIDVLVGGSPVFNRQAQLIVDALVDRGLSVAIKLHPSQSLTSSGMRRRFPPAQLEIFEGKDDFATIAARARVYIPANPTSTTSYEAVELGAKLIVVDFEGRRVSSAIDDLVTARVDDVEALAPLLSEQLGSE
jgi:hypothetical protein